MTGGLRTPAAGRWLDRVGPTDRRALEVWLVTRLGVLVVVSSAAWLLAGDAKTPVGALARWDRWDAVHYRTIAQWGYDGHPRLGPQVPLEAFFPGYPLVLRFAHVFVPGWTLAGLVVSLLAGAVAVVALARLAELDGPQGSGERAVLALTLAPSAVFLFAGYTEAVFLALAVPAWLAARRGRWPTAALLTAGASSIRVTGLFLAVALAVEYATAADRPRRPSDVPWLLAPLVPVVAYASYLKVRTGDWFAWLDAQAEGWNRHFTAPWEAFETTWRGATEMIYSANWTWMFRAEIVAVGVGLVLCGWLLWRSRWGELTYVGLQVAALATSTFYFSVPRATLLWWPLWIGLGQLAVRHRAVMPVYLAVSAPLSAVIAIAFTQGSWAG